MRTPEFFLQLVLLIATILLAPVESNSESSSLCEFSVLQGDNLYNFSLASPVPNYPHGVLSEDGFYKVAVNETTLWFQLCDGMLFNHDPPRCFGCQDCGGPSHCGMKCSALAADYLLGYYVCATIGQTSSTNINLIDSKNPNMGVIVKMSSSGGKFNCSLSVSIFCDANGVQGPQSLEKLGVCHYATVLMHPAGCAKIIPVHGRGWGWFATLLTIFACLLGGYLVAGTVYRYFALGIRGIEVIPNLEFWISIPQKTQSFVGSFIRRFRRPTEGHRTTYSPVNF